MTRIHCGLMALVAAIIMMCCFCCPAAAQRAAGPSPDELEDLARDLGMDPAKCNAVQKQINEVVAVYQSSLTDEEKIARLSGLWSQSAAGLQKSASADAEVASTANQYLGIMEALVAMAKDSPGGSDKNASAAAMNSLKKLKGLTQNYVNMMKVLCPNLTLPPIMNQ